MSSPSNIETSETLIEELLKAIDNLFGLHPGFRPVHAKGLMLSGEFTPSEQAVTLTRAPHAQAPSTDVIVRFSNFSGVPMIPDNDANASPRGFAIRFNLAPHVHTDIIGHSHNGFPTRTGEEFLELARALVNSGPDASKPTQLDTFLSTHPKAKHFFESPNPIPSSFAKESFFAVTAFRFTNKESASLYGRFQIHPEDRNDYLDSAIATAKGENFLFEEIEERLAKGPIRLRIVVELAEDGDNVSDATVAWPTDRRRVNFGAIVLNQLVSDEDVEARRIIFDPIPRVDGIDPSDDPLINVRSAIYLLSGRRRRAASTK
ncbi:MAG: catalase family peroxidase [Candidatus Obscuribacterales bacterium]|nr:catalase family peroxidase [Candidatus Obscuribacterales bacterium]